MSTDHEPAAASAPPGPESTATEATIPLIPSGNAPPEPGPAGDIQSDAGQTTDGPPETGAAASPAAGPADEEPAERPRWNAPVGGPGEVRAEPVDHEPEAEARITFSPPPGSYPPPLTVELASDVPGVEIRWTDDGTAPTEGSPGYAEPLIVTRSCTVTARAFWRGRPVGPEAHAGYELRAPEWKVLEPDDRADAVPHHLIGAKRFEWGWAVAAASRRGKLHAHRGLWREDAFAVSGKEPWSVIAVADGAGSARLSRVGSRVACETALRHLGDALPGGGLRAADTDALKEELAALREALAQAARLALEAVRAEAGGRGEPLEAFACTLLLAVHCPWRGQQLVGCLQVGDGAVALLGGAGELTLLGTPDHGDHSSETRFLTTRGVEETLAHRTSFSVKPELRALAVMTDGVSDDFFPEEKRLGELFTGRAIGGMATRDGGAVDGILHGVVGDERPHRALSRWLEYERKGSSDDRTLVLLWREP
jgi:serine/threonine protein phosphatase PrpC